MTVKKKPSRSSFEGSMVALVTPFRNGEIDWPALKRLIEWHLEEGTDVLVPCGTTGEASTMTHEEHRAMMDFVTDQVRGRVPVICGAGSNCTTEALGLVEYAKRAGADGVLVVVPYYNKPTQEGLYRHYEYIASRVEIPIVLYNVPGRTGVSMAPETVARLRKIPNIVAIKEASGKLEQTERIRELCDITVISGEDALTWPLMRAGAQGVISVTANVTPKKVAAMVHAALEGSAADAERIHQELLPLSNALFIETNPIPVKTALGRMGKIHTEFRLPLCEMSEKHEQELVSVLTRMGLVKGEATHSKPV